MALDSIEPISDRREQAYTLAELNLQAGTKAMKMSNFEMAFEIFDHGRLKSSLCDEFLQLSMP